MAIYFFDPFIKKLGYTSESEKDGLLTTLYGNLKKIGFEPKHIVDVGANRGTWTRKTMCFFPDAYYTLVEPQKELSNYFKDLLSKPTVIFYPVGAGSKSETLKFTFADRDDSSSFVYNQEDVIKRGFVQKDIAIKPLNEILQENAEWPVPDIIKIDAEGLDIDVLKGASNYFGKTEIFMVEAAVFEKEFQNSVSTVITFMDEIDYKLFEITDLNRPFQPQFLWLMEMVFIKKGGLIDSYKVI
ncbi:FkbM family methyltransferase [Flavobacterium qiangtangense]|uniref:FkbM family methyltransferase n=1 Tax=Flavobacterium qiangtangense TaxID=1442595 RepID=A0ABW1PT37_9FLAO